MFSKKVIEPEEAEVKNTELMQVEDTNDVFAKFGISPGELEKAGVSKEVIAQISMETSKKEDYSSNVTINRTIDELPNVVTVLIDLLDEKNGELKTLKDGRGIWLDVVGAKGNIPGGDVPYHKRANISAILTELTNDVYRIEYRKDDEGELILDECGKPEILTKTAVNVGTEKRNLDSLNNLAVNGNTRDTQARILGAYGGGSGVGIDGRLEGALSSVFNRKKGR